ncbi:hypothetical protein BA6E_12526 [Bacteroidales bacterium 6E]|nr:hypothetical protein BA6E_12526 [Bacteroidales bacterium 6E]
MTKKKMKSNEDLHDQLLNGISELSLVELLYLYLEAKTGEYFDLESNAPGELLERIDELEEDLNELIN